MVVASVTDPVMDMEQQQLRFGEGQRVECNMGEAGWVKGTIDSLWHRQNGWGSRGPAPYSIATDDGGSIFAPRDDDGLIRELVE